VITDGRLEEQVPLYVSNKIETEERKFADEIDLDEPDHVRGKAADGSEEKQVVTQFDKNWIETSGLLKIDYLGLETLAVIDETLKMIKRRHHLDIELEKVPMNDRKTFRIFQEGKMAGIFQFESSGMQSYMTRLQPTQIGDIIAMSALYRPGALNARIDEKRNAVDLFVDRKHGREAIDYMHPMLETILKETYGVIVYQEQVMQISQVMGGFSLAKADNLRKAMGKKKPEIMEKYKVDFVQGAIQQGYLKAHYTIEFVTAVLNSEIGDIERMKHLTDEAKSFGISTLPPSINKSDALFSVEDSGGRSHIRVGLSAIKQVGAAARAVVTSRLRRKRDFVNLFDLAASVDLRVMNRKALECLILSGAFDVLDPHRARLLANVDKAFKFGQMQNRSVTLGQCGFFTAEEGAMLEEEHYPDMDQAEMMAEAEKLLHEKKLVGFYLSHHPLSPYRRDWQAFATLQLHAKEVVAAKQYKVIGLVVSVKPYQDRKGKQMLFGSIEDFTGKADFTVFASLYEQYGHLIKPEEVLMLVAEGEVSGGMLKLLVREVIPIKKVRHALVKKIILKVDADDQMQMEKLGRVKKIFDSNKGGTPVEFEVKAQSGDNIETISIFARSTPIDAGESTIEKLEEVLGPDNVRISG
jgi:DNA polymerase-3 subunit alpha